MKRTVVEAKAALANFETIGELREALRQAPPELDPRLSARAVFPMLDDQFPSRSTLARAAPTLRAHVVRALQARCLEAPRNLSRVFVLEAVDPSASDREVEAQWKRAVEALAAFDSSRGWGDTQLITLLKKLSRDARVLNATAAAVLATRRPPRNALAVLAIEGGEAALDALIAHRARASLKREFKSLAKVASPKVAALLET